MGSEIVRLGQLASGQEGRDAVHVAIIPMCAKISLEPGTHLDVNGGLKGQRVGVVDPFLTRPVRVGEWFYLCLYPNTVTSLRHEWTHPAFPRTTDSIAESERLVSEKWLRNFCRENSADYDELVKDASGGKGYCFGDDYGPDSDEFWDHLEVVTGMKFDRSHRESTYFQCAC